MGSRNAYPGLPPRGSVLWVKASQTVRLRRTRERTAWCWSGRPTSTASCHRGRLPLFRSSAAEARVLRMTACAWQPDLPRFGPLRTRRRGRTPSAVIEPSDSVVRFRVGRSDSRSGRFSASEQPAPLPATCAGRQVWPPTWSMVTVLPTTEKVARLPLDKRIWYWSPASCL